MMECLAQEVALYCIRVKPDRARRDQDTDLKQRHWRRI